MNNESAHRYYFMSVLCFLRTNEPALWEPLLLMKYSLFLNDDKSV